MTPVWVVDGVFRIGYPSECVLALVSGLPSRERTTHRMAVIQAQAYADDSGKAPPVYVFSGFVSSSAAWALFSDEWQDALDTARPHKVSYMKMRDAYALRNQFLGSSEPERDDLLRLLWKIVNKHAQYGISVIIDANQYLSTFKDKIARTLDSPYLILNDHFVRSVLQAERERGFTRIVNFIFDNQGAEEKDVEIFWKLRISIAPRWMRKRLGENPIWRPEQQFRPLQAADMLAWATRRIAEKILAAGDIATHRNFLARGDIVTQLRSFIPELSIPIHSPVIEIENIGQAMVDIHTTQGRQYETAKMRSKRRKSRITQNP